MIVTTDHTRRCRKFSELIIVKFEIPPSTTTTFCVSVDALVLTAIFRQQQLIYFPKVAEVEVTLHNFSKQLFFSLPMAFSGGHIQPNTNIRFERAPPVSSRCRRYHTHCYGS